MTLQLDALEQSASIISDARRNVLWVSHENPVWLTLWHAERYVSEEFKREFNDYFKEEEKETEQ